jgi:tetratricopeptide (TPR) repeat protein
MSESVQILVAALAVAVVALGACRLWQRAQASWLRAEARNMLQRLRALPNESEESGIDQLKSCEAALSRLEGVSVAEKRTIQALIDEAAALYDFEIQQSETALRDEAAALYYFEIQEYETALKHAERVLAVNEGSTDALHLKAGCLAHLARTNPETKEALLTEAHHAIRRAISLDSKGATRYVALGWILEEMGNCQDAIEAYDEANRLQPTLGHSVYSRACALAKLGAFKEALGSLELLAAGPEPDHWLGRAATDSDLTETLGRDPTLGPEFHKLVGRGASDRPAAWRLQQLYSSERPSAQVARSHQGKPH